MKITKSLKERLFVMFLRMDIDLTRRVGQTPNMNQSVGVATASVDHAVDVMVEHSLRAAKRESEAGGEA